MKLFGRWSAAFLLVVISGCAEPYPPASFTTTTESGIPWVHNSGSGAWAEQDRWIAETVLTLGTLDRDTAQQFGSVRGLALAGDTLVVLDRQAQVLRLFDVDGTPIRAIGGRGGGPGEFGFVDGVVSTEPGLLHAHDVERMAIHEFSVDGDLRRSIRHVPGAAGGFAALLRVESVTYDWIFDFQSPKVGRAARDESLVRFRPIRVDPVSSAVDTFPPVYWDLDDSGGRLNPLGGDVQVAVTPNPEQFWFGMGAEYEVALRTLGGDTLRILSLDDFDRAAVPAAVADSIQDTDPDAAADLPAQYPAIDFLLSDGQGHLLVVPHATGVDRRSVVDVFDESLGTYLGRVTLPIPLAAFPKPVVSGDLMLAAVDGPLGTLQPVLLRLGGSR